MTCIARNRSSPQYWLLTILKSYLRQPRTRCSSKTVACWPQVMCMKYSPRSWYLRPLITRSTWTIAIGVGKPVQFEPCDKTRKDKSKYPPIPASLQVGGYLFGALDRIRTSDTFEG